MRLKLWLKHTRAFSFRGKNNEYYERVEKIHDKERRK